ncbi:hypothetical protein ACIRD9_42510 [Streptomyces violaceus]|uniref:hypothetical protein n=1 Tax=Streptomyces violaceus TaxID=1936 RepID=UPI00382730DF
MEVVFWKEKTGPLPNWAWGGLVLGGAVAYSSWQRNKAAAAAEDEEATSTASGIELPGDVAPTYVFQNYDQDVTTINQAPAGGGRPPIVTLPAPTKPPVTPPKPPTKPTPKPTPPKAPVGKYVSVAKWNSKKAPWNSTIWGIANKLLGPKVSWQTVWNAPQNKALRDKRKDPKKIQPGDKVWVPGAK